MILPVSDNFCDYVMFGIIFQRVLRELVGGCWLFREVGYSLLVSVVKELKTRKKIDPRIFLTPLFSSILVRG